MTTGRINQVAILFGVLLFAKSPAKRQEMELISFERKESKKQQAHQKLEELMKNWQFAISATCSCFLSSCSSSNDARSDRSAKQKAGRAHRRYTC